MFRLMHLSMVLAHLIGWGMVWDVNSFWLVCLSLGLAHLMDWSMVGVVVWVMVLVHLMGLGMVGALIFFLAWLGWVLPV